MTEVETRIGHLLVEPVDGVPGRPWCLHSSEPHSAWIEFYRSREEAAEDARAMLERRNALDGGER